MCNIEKTLWTEDPTNQISMDINSAAVLGAISTGCGYTQMAEQHAVFNMPTMSYKRYVRHHNKLYDVLQKTAWTSMKEAGKEEFQLGVENGEVDSNGVPCITVIADGAWSKRSYKTNYDALSGVVS